MPPKKRRVARKNGPEVAMIPYRIKLLEQRRRKEIQECEASMHRLNQDIEHWKELCYDHPNSYQNYSDYQQHEICFDITLLVEPLKTYDIVFHTREQQLLLIEQMKKGGYRGNSDPFAIIIPKPDYDCFYSAKRKRWIVRIVERAEIQLKDAIMQKLA